MAVRKLRFASVVGVVAATLPGAGPPSRGGGGDAEEVERAIRGGSATSRTSRAPTARGSTSTRTRHTGTHQPGALALLTAGEPANSADDRRASTTCASPRPSSSGAPTPSRSRRWSSPPPSPSATSCGSPRNVAWLETAQIKPGDRGRTGRARGPTPTRRSQPGDNSNTQYALLGLNAASEAGVPVKPEVWALARHYWEQCQQPRRRLGLHARRRRRPTGQHDLRGDLQPDHHRAEAVPGAGDPPRRRDPATAARGASTSSLQRGIDWLARPLPGRPELRQRPAVEVLLPLRPGARRPARRASASSASTTGTARGPRSWSTTRTSSSGFWQGGVVEDNPVVATSFALLFLAKGRAPVLINKLRHGPGDDWNNDPDDVRNLVGVVSRDWKHLLTWQVVDPDVARVEDLLQAPIVFFNGHEAPEFDAEAQAEPPRLRRAGRLHLRRGLLRPPEFDAGFRELMKEVFPEPEYKLHPLAEDHAVWRAKHLLTPDVHPLWGIEHGCRTVVIYSPEDLSCYWNQVGDTARPTRPSSRPPGRPEHRRLRHRPRDARRQAGRPRGHATSRPSRPSAGALHIAKLRHAGDWNIAPLADPQPDDAAPRPARASTW